MKIDPIKIRDIDKRKHDMCAECGNYYPKSYITFDRPWIGGCNKNPDIHRMIEDTNDQRRKNRCDYYGVSNIV
jgi:hypothetical protein